MRERVQNVQANLMPPKSALEGSPVALVSRGSSTALEKAVEENEKKKKSIAQSFDY